MTVALHAGWVITPLVEVLQNPNVGTPAEGPFFARQTYICTNGSGDYVCSSGALEDCEAQALTMAQSSMQQNVVI